MENYQKQKPRGNLMPKRYLHGPMTCMEGHAKKCGGRYCELSIQRRNKCTKSRRHALMTINLWRRNWISWRIVHSLLTNVLKWLFLARLGGLDILWCVNKLARAVTKWTKACGKRLARLTSYIHHTSEYRQYGYVGNTAQQCRIGSFQDSDFAGDLDDSKSISGGILCIFRKPNNCASKLDVQETGPQSHTVQKKLKSSLSMQVYAWWDSHSRSLAVGKYSAKTCENKFQPRTPISICTILITFHQTEHILVAMLCCLLLRTMKPWLK